MRRRHFAARAARFAGALLPMLAVAGAAVALSSPSCARAVRSLDPVLDSWRGVGRSLSVYEPSRMEVVDAVMDLLALGQGDTLVDIGSGDGRFVVAAAAPAPLRSASSARNRSSRVPATTRGWPGSAPAPHSSTPTR